MRKAELFFIAFLLIVGLFSNGSLAQGYTQWNLPEGATTQEPIIIDDTRQRVLALALSPDGKILAHARTLPMTVNTTVYLYSTETTVEGASNSGKHTRVPFYPHTQDIQIASRL